MDTSHNHFAARREDELRPNAKSRSAKSADVPVPAKAQPRSTRAWDRLSPSGASTWRAQQVDAAQA